MANKQDLESDKSNEQTEAAKELPENELEEVQAGATRAAKHPEFSITKRVDS